MAQIAPQSLPLDVAGAPHKRADAAPRGEARADEFERQLDATARDEDRARAREARETEAPRHPHRVREPQERSQFPDAPGGEPTAGPDDRDDGFDAMRACECACRPVAGGAETSTEQDAVPQPIGTDIGRDGAEPVPGPAEPDLQTTAAAEVAIVDTGAPVVNAAAPTQGPADAAPANSGGADAQAVDPAVPAADQPSDQTDPLTPGDLVSEGAGASAGAASGGAPTQEGGAIAPAQDGHVPPHPPAIDRAAPAALAAAAPQSVLVRSAAGQAGEPVAPMPASHGHGSAEADPGSEFALRPGNAAARANTGDSDLKTARTTASASIQPTAASGTAVTLDAAAPGGVPAATADALSAMLPTAQNSSTVSMRVGVSPHTGQPVHLPANTIAFAIARNVENGVSRFQIRIDPPELGRVDVRLDMSVDGRARAHLSVERSETLELLQRDARALERALADAGLDVDRDSLQFSLKDHGGFAAGSDDDGNGAASAMLDEADEAPVDAALAGHAMRGYITDTAVDISV
jgi:flagellar hook-length control protein FliK